MKSGVGITEGQMMTNLNLFLKCIGKNLTKDGRKTLTDLYPKTEFGNKWRFSIPETFPVEFTAGQTDVADELHPQFFGYIIGPGEKWTFSEYSICFRVWSSKKNHNYWKSTDSDLARQTFIDDEAHRLILRIRFDLHEKKEGILKSHHPWFHMHIGGKSKIEHLDPRVMPPEGHYRYHPSIDTPRMPTFPMSFILLGRSILANYHPIDYKNLCKDDDEWNSLIAREEENVWKVFFQKIQPLFSTSLVTESCFDRISMDSRFEW